MRDGTPRSAFPSWGWMALAVLLASTLFSIGHRYRVEQRNRGVGVLLEIDLLRSLAALTGQPLRDVLAEARIHGLSGVALTEQTIGDLVRAGALRRDGSRLAAVEEDVVGRVERGLAIRLGRDRARLPLDGLDAGVVDSISVGIDPADAAAARSAGLTIVARLANPIGITEDGVRASLNWAHENGAAVFVPFGDQALGQRELLENVAESLRSLGFLYASPEFARIAGESTLSKMIEDRLVRLHSVQTAEADRLSPKEFVDRFARAFKERNIRLLLLRPAAGASDDPLGALYERLRAVRTAIEKEGGRVVSLPRPFDEPGVPSWIFPVIAIAASSVVFGGIVALFPGPHVRWGVGATLLIVSGLAAIESQRPFAATAYAIAMPIVGYAWLLDRRKQSVVGAYAIITMFSVAGGLTVAGLLNGVGYFVRTDQFFAVKLAHFAPILLAGVILLREQVEPRVLWRSPAAWGPAVLAIGTVAALALMALRTGNDNPAAVSGLELKLRGLLDELLPARPRTKEFLVGHPAMILGLGLRALERPPLGGWSTLGLTIGAIGQTSIVNTLCHLHTPIDVGLTRVAIGWVLGAGVGFLAWTLLRPRIDR